MVDEAKNRLEGRECVPFFKSDKAQIIFEFIYLIVIFLLASIAMLLLQFYFPTKGMLHADKIVLFSILGGFIGGWVYDTKWFYRVTARGKNDQYNFPWQPHKFYWRILTPFLSAIVAFCTYLLIVADFLPIQMPSKESGKLAFSLSFLLGYFSDLVLSRLAAWAEKVVPKVSNGK